MNSNHEADLQIIADPKRATRLDEALGPLFRVHHFKTGAYYPSYEITIVRIQDLRYEVFDLAKDVLDEAIEIAKRCIYERFDKTPEESRENLKRRVAFESVVKFNQWSLPLQRLENDTRYESLETEWAFQGYCAGIACCIGHKV